tara:strand:- start:1639 stop:1833 length:195 start_codon:yes stop_codon:yes gene_type:complete
MIENELKRAALIKRLSDANKVVREVQDMFDYDKNFLKNNINADQGIVGLIMDIEDMDSINFKDL